MIYQLINPLTTQSNNPTPKYHPVPLTSSTGTTPVAVIHSSQATEQNSNPANDPSSEKAVD